MRSARKQALALSEKEARGTLSADTGTHTKRAACAKREYTYPNSLWQL